MRSLSFDRSIRDVTKFPYMLASFAMCLASCSQQRAAVPDGPEQALTVARAYAATHYPKDTFQPNGARMQYFVRDAGSVWKAEIGPADYIGGGLALSIRKSDMKVISAHRTQ